MWRGSSPPQQLLAKCTADPARRLAKQQSSELLFLNPAPGHARLSAVSHGLLVSR
jgi:hypothetical protein